MIKTIIKTWKDLELEVHKIYVNRTHVGEYFFNHPKQEYHARMFDYFRRYPWAVVEIVNHHIPDGVTPMVVEKHKSYWLVRESEVDDFLCDLFEASTIINKE